MYRVGVEDDGCHSLLDYETIAESCRLLECLARTLNAVVVERRMIQGEVVVDDVNGNPVKKSDNSDNNDNGDDDDDGIVTVFEAPLLGRDDLGVLATEVAALSLTLPHYHHCHHHDQHDHDGQEQPVAVLQKGPKVYTRAELTIVRIETHLLDSSPVSLADLIQRTGRLSTAASTTTSSTTTDNDTAAEPPILATPASATLHDGSADAAADADAAGKTTTSSASTNNINSTNNNIGDTLSARNLRVAVVGNVDAGKSTLIGVRFVCVCEQDEKNIGRISTVFFCAFFCMH
jgi:hypothetical protein